MARRLYTSKKAVYLRRYRKFNFWQIDDFEKFYQKTHVLPMMKFFTLKYR